MKEFTAEYRKMITEKYPWIAVHDNYYKDAQDAIWAEYMPQGWWWSFGEQMCEELDQLIHKYDMEEFYYISQVKEKYGELRWYDEGFATEGWDEYCEWLKKYENMSWETCAICGEPATYTEVGWVLPVCEHCKSDKARKREVE